MKENKKQKEKVLKIILIISFVPYLLLMLVLFLYIYSIFFHQSTSDRGYWENIEMAFSMIKPFGIIAQIALICFIYQIFYLTRHLIKKHKSKKLKKEDDLI